ENVRPGQRVRLSFNTYPGRIFPGVVQTVGWGGDQGQGTPSGNLPVVDEPKNWIRLAQRFQVRIAPQVPAGYPLRVGATASVAVYTEEHYWLNPVTEAWQRVVATFASLRGASRSTSPPSEGSRGQPGIACMVSTAAQ